MAARELRLPVFIKRKRHIPEKIIKILLQQRRRLSDINPRHHRSGHNPPSSPTSQS